MGQHTSPGVSQGLYVSADRETIATGDLPLERSRHGLVTCPEPKQSVVDPSEGRGVFRGRHSALDHREVGLDLVDLPISSSHCTAQHRVVSPGEQSPGL